MKARVAVAALLGMALALSISVGFAGSNDYPVGRAVLAATNSSGVTGEAIVRRQLTSATTHVMVRASGLASTSAPIWKIETGTQCGTTPTATATPKTAPPPVPSLSTFMTAETYNVTLAVDSGVSMMTVRIY